MSTTNHDGLTPTRQIAHARGHWLECVKAHLDQLLDTGLAEFGPSPAPMWMASLDTRTGRYPGVSTKVARKARLTRYISGCTSEKRPRAALMSV